LAGPVEATAMGNLLIQAMAKGQIGSLTELREIMRNSTQVHAYSPENSDDWDEAYEKFQKLI